MVLEGVAEWGRGMEDASEGRRARAVEEEEEGGRMRLSWMRRGRGRGEKVAEGSKRKRKRSERYGYDARGTRGLLTPRVSLD